MNKGCSLNINSTVWFQSCCYLHWVVSVYVKTFSTISTETCGSYGRRKGHNYGECSPARAVKWTTPKCCTSWLSFACSKPVLFHDWLSKRVLACDLTVMCHFSPLEGLLLGWISMQLSWFWELIIQNEAEKIPTFPNPLQPCPVSPTTVGTGVSNVPRRYFQKWGRITPCQFSHRHRLLFLYNIPHKHVLPTP